MTATLVPNGKQQFTDALGVPLALGQVFFYITGTTTFKNTWQDNLQVALNANPVQLDAAGRASIYGTGDYRQIVQDRLGNTIWDQVTSVTPDLSTLAATTGASVIGFQQSGTGAVARTVQTKAQDPLSLFDFIPDALHAGILSRTVDNTSATALLLSGYIQAAIDAASAQRRTLTIPAGLYNIAPGQTFAAEAGSIVRCFTIRSHMHIEAELGASFRIVNGVSIDAAPVFMCMFGTNAVLQNVSWRGLEMDMNGANNMFSPGRPTTYQLYNQAQIHVTGTPAGVAARISDATIDACRFINGYGVSCIVLGQSNTVGSGVGSRWLIRGNVFYNNGWDTNDHSSVYGWAENVTVIDNTFYNDTQVGAAGGGGLVAYEVHGSGTIFMRNRITKYYQGLWIDGNTTNNSYGVKIVDNILDQMGAFGIIHFGQASGALPVLGCLIQGNSITFDDTVQTGVGLKFGIGTAGLYSQTDAYIKDNYIRGVGAVTAKAGIVVTAGNIAGQKHTRWVIEGNTSDNTTFGVAIISNATVGLGVIEVRNNNSINLIVAGAFAYPQGVGVTGGTASIDDISIVGNVLTNDTASPPATYGVYVSGTVNRYTLLQNRSRGSSVTPYAEATFTATVRAGVFVTSSAYTPGALAAGASMFADVTVPNAVAGDATQVALNVPLQGLIMTSGVQSAGVVRVSFQNSTAGSVTLVSGSIFVTLTKALST